MYNYESFPVDCVLNDIESYNKQSKKIWKLIFMICIALN